MDQKLYELEVERTRNLGNMTNALLMLASSMDALTRYSFLAPYLSNLFTIHVLRVPIWLAKWLAF